MLTPFGHELSVCLFGLTFFHSARPIALIAAASGVPTALMTSGPLLLILGAGFGGYFDTFPRQHITDE